MAGKTFRTWMKELSNTPMQGEFGAKYFQGMLGLFADMLSQAALEAVSARFFFSTTFPADALVPLGNERQMPRYPAETNAGYLDRIHDAWNAWQEAGTELGIIRQYGHFGVTVRIRANFQWDWDSMPENWSRFWVEVIEHPWDDEGVWGDGQEWGDGGTWGSTATVEDIATLKAIGQAWKGGHDVLVNIIIVLDDGVYGGVPTGDWDLWVNRDEGAIYVDGL